MKDLELERLRKLTDAIEMPFLRPIIELLYHHGALEIDMRPGRGPGTIQLRAIFAHGEEDLPACGIN